MSIILALLMASAATSSDGDPQQEIPKSPVVREIDRIGAGHATTLVYDVDEAGRVMRCAVSISSGSAGLDDEACEILKNKARFRPKLNAQGKPIKDLGKTTRIVWNITE